MREITLILIMSMGTLFFIAAFFVMLILFLRAKKENLKNESELVRLQGELENSARMSSAKEEYHIHRLNDKDDACRQLISSKEEAYAKSLSDKMAAYEQLLHEKDKTLAEREKSFATAVLEKDEACKRVLAEKDRALQQKDDACTLAIAEKEKACAAAIAEKDEACKRVLAEKDRALQQKDDACALAIAEKEKACAAAIAEKDEACKRVLAEKNCALQQKDDACAATIAEKEKACAAIVAEKDAALARKDADCRRILEEKNAEIAKFLQEKEKSFAAAVETLKEQFANIAISQMKAQSEGLSKSNIANLDAILAPLRDQVKLLQELADRAQKESQSLGVSMSKDVLDMGKIAKSLQHVANALTSNTRFQGRKGEDILAEKLRQAGLEENVNFFLQQGTDSDRPDVQVRDTENRWLIIDSKVSLTAYIEYMEATDESLKAEKLAQHVASVRQKIDQLAKKKYPKVLAAENKDRNYLPITAMFVPYEAPLMEALRAEPSLWQHAAENNVILITPLTLLAYLRLVYLAWQHEKEARNQQEIVDTARELLARLNSFLKTFEDVGHAIDALADTYTKAKGSLVDAPHAHTIAKSARKLIDLHVRLENKKGKKLEKAECLRDPDDIVPLSIQEQAPAELGD